MILCDFFSCLWRCLQHPRGATLGQNHTFHGPSSLDMPTSRDGGGVLVAGSLGAAQDRMDRLLNRFRLAGAQNTGNGGLDKEEPDSRGVQQEDSEWARWHGKAQTPGQSWGTQSSRASVERHNSKAQTSNYYLIKYTLMWNSIEDRRTSCRDKYGFKIPVQSLTSCVTLEKLLTISESISSSVGTISLL